MQPPRNDPRQQQQQQQSQQSVMVRIPTNRPVLTYVLLGIIVGIFFVQALLWQLNGKEPITAWGALDYDAVLKHGEYYRLFTAMFLHANQVHLFFNALALYLIGRPVEAFFGTARFGLIYMLGGLCGSVASFVFTRGYSVGASGALFAIIGAEIVFLYMNRRLFGQHAVEQLRSLVIMAVLNFGLGIFTEVVPGTVSIDNWAHIGGFFAGIVLAWFMGPQYHLLPDASVPAGLRIEDSISLQKSWVAPALFIGGLVLTMVYAVVNLR
jgi:rhomboid protease GluP